MLTEVRRENEQILLLAELFRLSFIQIQIQDGKKHRFSIILLIKKNFLTKALREGEEQKGKERERQTNMHTAKLNEERCYSTLSPPAC